MKPQHPGEHVIFLPLVRRDDWMCVEIQAAGLFILSNLSLFKHPERSVDVEFERETDVKEKLKAAFGFFTCQLPMCNSQQR